MKIAIIGTIGSGKTEVSNHLRKLGYDVFDCDEVNRKLLNERGYELLYNSFPTQTKENTAPKPEKKEEKLKAQPPKEEEKTNIKQDKGINQRKNRKRNQGI